jgi:hypothetical protein
LINATNGLDINIDYQWKSDLDLVLDHSYDMVFIDTYHCYGQLKRELDKFNHVINKYIIMHDTTIDGVYGECYRGYSNVKYLSEVTGYSEFEIKCGLQQAINEFITNNPQWSVLEQLTNNNGLTILTHRPVNE